MAKITIEELFYGDKYGVMGEVVKQVFARQAWPSAHGSGSCIDCGDGWQPVPASLSFGRSPVCNPYWGRRSRGTDLLKWISYHILLGLMAILYRVFVGLRAPLRGNSRKVRNFCATNRVAPLDKPA